MSHSFTSCIAHCVFSTKQRVDLITPDKEERLWAFMGGIARKNGAAPLLIGGTSNHAHLLLSLSSTSSISRILQAVKGGSSAWFNDSFRGMKFAWQEGYGAFSIGVSQCEATLNYIRNQKEHHKRQDFQAEFLSFLKKHKVEYDPRYIWD